MFLQILLVVFLCFPEGLSGNKLCDNLFVSKRVVLREFGNVLLRGSLLCVVMIEND